MNAPENMTDGKTGPCVNVLLSAYNGERYIKQQIDSLLNQDYGNTEIYARDDGSTDGTVGILRSYEDRGLTHLITGENLGYGASFLTLLRDSGRADYYAFCDQDDIWKSDKISRAVKVLENFRSGRSPLDGVTVMDHSTEGGVKNVPVLYCHHYMNFRDRPDEGDVNRASFAGYTFQKAITQCEHMGFATVFDDNMRKVLLKNFEPERIVSHDWLAELVAMGFGILLEDSEVLAYHRRLESSESSLDLKSRIRWFMKALSGGSEIPAVTEYFMRRHGRKLDRKDYRVLSLFITRTFTARVTKALYPKRWRSSLASEVALRLLMMAGKV